MKKYIKALVLTVVLLAICFIVVVNINKDTDEIKIGFIGSLTGLDPSYGEAMRGGMQIAIDEINQKGGINGKKIVPIYEDGRCVETKTALSAAQKLISFDKVKYIIGGGCSNEVSAVVDLITKEKVVLLSAGASSLDLSGASDYLFRNAINDNYTARVLATKIFSDNHKKIIIISDKTDYSQAFRKAFLTQGQSNNLDIIDLEVQTNQTDYRTDLLKIINIKDGAIFINPNTPNVAGRLVKQARQLGINLPVYIAYHSTPVFVEEAGLYAEGVIAVNLPIPTSVKAQKVLAKYEEIYQHKTVYSYNTVAAYDLVYILSDVINKVGENPEKVMVEIKKYQVSGALGEYKFDQFGDISDIQLRFEKHVNGGWVSL